MKSIFPVCVLCLCASVTQAQSFHSTLDSVLEIAKPATGSGVGSVLTAPMVPGGIRSLAPGESVRWLNSDGVVENLDLVAHTVEFLWRPAFNAQWQYGRKHILFSDCAWTRPGCYALVYFGMMKNNEVRLCTVFWRPEGGSPGVGPPIDESCTAPLNGLWVAGQPITVRVAKNMKAVPGELNFSLWLNDLSFPLDQGHNPARGPRSTSRLPAQDWFYLAGRNTGSSDGANTGGGDFLDIKVWPGVVPPVPAGARP